jgi:3-hydroxymyristoyl/3-hydroxydecanoyl-(acyl carrier protein) dehydratase
MENGGDIDETMTGDINVEEENDDGASIHSTMDDEDDEDQAETVFPEKFILPLPSNLGKVICSQLGISYLIKQEIELRKAQAQEHLEHLRLALGLKSALFRKSIAPAKSQKAKTRAWSTINNMDKTVNIHARRYRNSRGALIRLEADKEAMSCLLELKTNQLKMSGDITEENRLDQRRDKVAWFWRHQAGTITGELDWFDESEHHSGDYNVLC